MQSLPKKSIAKNLTELYMINRQEMLSCADEYSYYRHLMESISIGSAIIGDENGLSKDIKSILNDKSNYPKSRNMDYHSSNHTYSCSSGDNVTGKVTVRPEELEQGVLSLRNQQSNDIIRRLTPIDLEIFNVLLGNGWIQKQSAVDGLLKELK